MGEAVQELPEQDGGRVVTLRNPVRRYHPSASCCGRRFDGASFQHVARESVPLRDNQDSDTVSDEVLKRGQQGRTVGELGAGADSGLFTPGHHLHTLATDLGVDG